MPREEFSERLPAGQPDAVHVAYAGIERRVMHEQQRRRIGCGAQGIIEPGQPFRAHRAAALSGHQRIETDEAQIAVVDSEVEKTVFREIAALGKRGTHALALVVIAGHDDHRHR